MIDGGLGSDTVSLAGSTVGMSVYLGGFGAAGSGYSWDGIAQDNLTSIENVTGSAQQTISWVTVQQSANSGSEPLKVALAMT